MSTDDMNIDLPEQTSASPGPQSRSLGDSSSTSSVLSELRGRLEAIPSPETLSVNGFKEYTTNLTEVFLAFHKATSGFDRANQMMLGIKSYSTVIRHNVPLEPQFHKAYSKALASAVNGLADILNETEIFQFILALATAFPMGGHPWRKTDFKCFVEALCRTKPFDKPDVKTRCGDPTCSFYAEPFHCEDKFHGGVNRALKQIRKQVLPEEPSALGGLKLDKLAPNRMQLLRTREANRSR